jgi:hypothetical protein
MPAFKAANADHAITAVAFVLEFDKQIEAGAIQNLISSANAQAAVPWSASLPAVTASPGLGGSLSGVQFSYVQPNARAAWLLRIAADEIRVECSVYTRWKKVWGTAEGYLRQAVEYINQSDKSISANRVTIQVIDKFVGAPTSYKIGELIRDRTIVGDTPFENGDLWHVFLGWFDLPKWGRVLNNFNVQSTGEGRIEDPLPVESAPYSVSITHFQQATPRKGLGRDLASLSEVMDFMHGRNKNLLERLLTDEQLDTIGLVRKGQ